MTPFDPRKTVFGRPEFGDDPTPVDEFVPLEALDLEAFDEPEEPTPKATDFDRDAKTPPVKALPGYESGRIDGRTMGIQEAIDHFFAQAIAGGTKREAAYYMASQLARGLHVKWPVGLPPAIVVRS